MIHHIKGNLLTSDCNFLIHQSNCLGGFGSGIAAQIRTQFPKVYQAFKTDNRKPEEKLGSFSMGIDNNKVIFNLYGQYHYGHNKNEIYTVYSAFEDGLNAVLTQITENFKPAKIGMPYLIGCGLAGGDWRVVYSIIENISTKYGVDIYLYEYTP